MPVSPGSGDERARIEVQPRSWPWFLAWGAVGGLMALGVLSIFSIGVFVLPVAAGLAVVVATRKGSFVGLAGLVSGCGIPLLWVAYLNRSGPGNLCWYHPDGGSGCVQEWNPWPFAVIGLLLIGVGVLAFTKSARPRPKVRSTRT